MSFRGEQSPAIHVTLMNYTEIQSAI